MRRQRQEWRQWLLIVLAALLALATLERPAFAKPSATAFYNAKPEELRAPPGTLLRSSPMAMPAFYRAKAWRILYVTRDYANRPIASSGLVMVSEYAEGEPKIVAWAHATIGIARKCAPTLRESPVGAVLGANELISGGYVVVATDYPGLGTIGPAGYLVGLGQGRAVLDSVRAVRQLLNIEGETRFALWGYSQGAHAALFAANIQKAYAPELSLIGVAAAALPTNLTALFNASANALEGRILSAMTLSSWSTKYGFPLDSIAPPSSVSAIGKIATYCIDDLSDQLDILTAEEPLEKEFLSVDPATTPPWSRLMSANSVRSIATGAPLFLTQGTADTLVPLPVTLNFVRSACQSGAKVKFVTLNNTGHGMTGKKSAVSAIAWIGDRFAGKPAPSTCR
jgi:pimeloyl-ACP methyl ester carboxylesterase